MKKAFTNQVLNLALQGNIPMALELCRNWSFSLNKTESNFRTRFMQRFCNNEKLPRLKTRDEFIKSLYRVYSEYWKASLLQAASETQAEDSLISALNELLIDNNFIPGWMGRKGKNILRSFHL
jgi:hypothetical protein